jgi:alpha(1,3/1,4) fucosyltransferase
MKRRVKVGIARFWSTATARELVELLVPDLADVCDFSYSGDPDLVLYGPYPGNLPRGAYTRVFIGCENVRPDMSECDWAFGVGHEETVRDPRYMRFVRWGDASALVNRGLDPELALRQKNRFCIFLYSNPVFYREAFFKALSTYKPVDAPGRSMNNMPAIDVTPGSFDWKTKIDFLRQYKFVIAFENSSFPGYNTEKLTHAIEADSLPIYWGDPEIERSFNVRRFINAHEFLPAMRKLVPRAPWSARATGGSGVTSFGSRLARKWNSLAREADERLAARQGFGALIDHVVRVDQDDSLYMKYLGEPLLKGDRLPDESEWRARWLQIFEGAAT